MNLVVFGLGLLNVAGGLYRLIMLEDKSGWFGIIFGLIVVVTEVIIMDEESTNN